MNPRDKLPKRHASHRLSTAAERAFENSLEGSDLFVQRGERLDYGTDYQVEVEVDGMATNVRLHVQLKGTDKDANKDGSVSIDIDQTNLNYLLMQSYAIYVCYHRPTDRLLMRHAQNVARQYQQAGGEWTNQATLTVNFRDDVSAARLRALATLAHAEAVTMREWRHSHIVARPGDVSALLRRFHDVHVPPDATDAEIVLRKMFDEGLDARVSAAADRFEAVLGARHPAILYIHLAQINLGMTGSRPDPKQVQSAIAFLASIHDNGHPDVGNVRYCLGNGHSALGQHEEASHWYRAAIDVLDGASNDDLLARCFKNLGASEEHLGDEEGAAARYRRALELNPTLAEAHLALGRMEHRRGNFAEAIEHYDNIVFDKGDPDRFLAVPGWRINALFNLNEGRAAFRDINGLISDAERADWIWPTCAAQVASFGRKNAANAKAAVAFWRRYLGVFPSNSDGTRELLLAKLFLHAAGEDIGTDYAGFRAEFDRGVALVGDEAAALLWDRLGHWAQASEDWAEAERCFRHAYQLEGGHYGYCLGTALSFLGRFEESLPLLQAQAEGLQPDAMSFNQLGHALEKLGRVEEAAEAYASAIRFDEGYDLAWFNLGGVLWNNDERVDAVCVWHEALARFPDHHLAAKLREDLPLLFASTPPDD
jgi:tetratricopeptide (TPR) repeat protein